MSNEKYIVPSAQLFIGFASIVCLIAASVVLVSPSSMLAIAVFAIGSVLMTVGTYEATPAPNSDDVKRSAMFIALGGGLAIAAAILVVRHTELPSPALMIACLWFAGVGLVSFGSVGIRRATGQ